MNDTVIKGIIGLLFAFGQAIALGAAGFAWNANAELVVLKSDVSALQRQAEKLEVQAKLTSENDKNIALMQKDIATILEVQRQNAELLKEIMR